MLERCNVRDDGCLGCGMLGMWDIGNMRCWGLWNVAEVECSRCRMLEMWGVGDVRC